MNFWFLKKKFRHVKLYDEISNTDLETLNTRKEIYEFFVPDLIIPELLYWVGPPPILHLPRDMIVMPGGHQYTPKHHPFMMALECGKDSLVNFYSTFSPRNIIEMYGIKRDGLHGEDLPPWEIPWLLRQRVPPSSEEGLACEHGVSFFGPATQDKIDLEMRRLNSVSKSIKAKGYRPKINNHIEGHFLKHGDEYRFFVFGGKHRASVLGLIKDGRVPVRVRASLPRVIDRRDSANWPLVKNKSMSEQLALKVFDAYFKIIPPSERASLAK